MKLFNVSINKFVSFPDSLLSTMTKLIDEKLKEEHSLPLVIASEDIPFVDESPEKLPPTKKMTFEEKENIPQSSDLYRNPSLHKNQYSLTKTNKKEYKEHGKETEKEEDTMATKNIPDNDKHFNRTLTLTTNKLKRSESLNKPDRSTFSLNKVKRSESLNKADHKLKRSDSLTKSEKTESNINKRRELSLTNKKIKDCSKNKRKNGMPDRSIKRRHTVGGTKDLENIKDTNLRTSSPDLNSAGRENIFFEINLICPENMIVALKKHLIGTRPQSFPESTVYKVPLESHV